MVPLQLVHAKGPEPPRGSLLNKLWTLGEVSYEAGKKTGSTHPGLLSGAPGEKEVGPGVVVGCQGLARWINDFGEVPGLCPLAYLKLWENVSFP